MTKLLTCTCMNARTQIVYMYTNIYIIIFPKNVTLKSWWLMMVRMPCRQTLPCVYERLQISVRFDSCCRKSLSVSTWTPYIWYQKIRHFPAGPVGSCTRKRDIDLEVRMKWEAVNKRLQLCDQFHLFVILAWPAHHFISTRK